MCIKRPRTTAHLLWLAVAIIAACMQMLPKAAANDSGANFPGGQVEMRGATCQILGICPLKHTDVTANIAGYAARVHVRQAFHNPSTAKHQAHVASLLDQERPTISSPDRSPILRQARMPTKSACQLLPRACAPATTSA